MTEAPLSAAIALLSAGGAAIIRSRFGSARLMRAGFVAAVVALGFLAALWFVVRPGHAVEHLVRVGALTSAVMSFAATGIQWSHGRVPAEGVAPTFVRLARRLALLFGVMSGTILLVVMGIRILYVSVELLTVMPQRLNHEFGYAREAVGSMGLLIAACAVSYFSTARTGLLVGLVVLLAMAGTWLALEAPVLHVLPSGVLVRSWGFTLMTVWLAIVLVFTAIVARQRAPRRVGAPGFSHGAWGAPEAHRTVGLSMAASVLAVSLICTLAHLLAVPLGLSETGIRAVMLPAMLAAGIGFAACSSLSCTWRSGPMADAAFGLFSLAITALVVAAVPEFPIPMDERYPVLFSAVILGLALACAVIGAVLCVVGRAEPETDYSPIFSMLCVHGQRGIFCSGALAVVVAGVMDFWPRFTGIATPDASLSRVSAGFGANLLLFVVLLACARQSGRPTHYALAALAFVSATTFMIVRVLPFTPRFG